MNVLGTSATLSTRCPSGTARFTVSPPTADRAPRSLYCPQTPRTLLELAPLSCAAAPAQAAAHDAKTAEAARYKLDRLTSDDTDGYHRAACPAATGKIRCPLQPPSMLLDSGDDPDVDDVYRGGLIIDFVQNSDVARV